MPECLLCNVVRGQLKAEKIIESDTAIGIMNTVEPLSRGHCVFFPKRHAPKLHDVDDQDLSEVLVLIKRVAAALELENYNVLQNNGTLANQTVFHAHFHLIPKWSEAEGLNCQHDTRKKIDQTEITQRLKAKLLRISRRAG